jgi:predicted acylesterase/phospholipase RssA
LLWPPATDPKALELFRKVMLASAAIPGAFPPVMIDVEVNGKPYQEMHVDGGDSGPGVSLSAAPV